MKITLKLFAIARDTAGVDVLQIELAEPATVADLKQQLVVDVPALGEILNHCSFAVNEEYAVDATPLTAGDIAACIPPVSGG